MLQAKAPTGRALRIVIADDDEASRKTVRHLFSLEQNFMVGETSSYDGLMTLLDGGDVDCVIVDKMLGTESGFAINDWVKASYKDPPAVIMLTGTGNERFAIKAFRGGFSNYIMKGSLTSSELISAVSLAVDRGRAEKLRRAELDNLALLAHRDRITGLPNRKFLEERLSMLMASGKRHKSSFVVLTIGMDGLAIINESFGYAVGDLALKAFAQRLMQRARSSDILGCFGGAQFLYLIDYDVSVATMEHSCRRLVDALSFSIELENVGLSLSASIGAAIYPADGATAAELLEATAGAMRRARELGGGYSLVSEPPPPRGENAEAGTAAAADDLGNQLPKFAEADPLFESGANPASAKASVTPGGENAPSEPLSEGRFASIPHEVADNRAPGPDCIHRDENRRAERRHRVLKRGILVTNNGFSTVDCVIRDLSAHGARVAVEAEYKAPPQFSLLVVETGNRLPAERRWQKGKEIGLRFLG